MIQTYSVRGLTCWRCMVSVIDEVRALPGVDGVQVDLVPFGESRVSVVPDGAVTRDHRFEPRLLVAYASMVGPLAQAQLSGQLHIRREKVVAASEVLTPDARAAARAAWGDSVVVDSHAATETASIASTCSAWIAPVRRLRDRRARGRGLSPRPCRGHR